ncbi:hypothetical protein WS67_23285 [Burkholderia singularis]|uniref:Uncharacterized protein n=1 Tax=Burkholderia singularis TaxID=1503053 RepID=A0A103DVR0_9BURK|nr:hypothetical protein WS67_23285 [Burkholderia singularis]
MHVRARIPTSAAPLGADRAIAAAYRNLARAAPAERTSNTASGDAHRRMPRQIRAPSTAAIRL